MAQLNIFEVNRVEEWDLGVQTIKAPPTTGNGNGGQ
jgi:hypothetical protein